MDGNMQVARLLCLSLLAAKSYGNIYAGAETSSIAIQCLALSLKAASYIPAGYNILNIASI